MRRNVPKLLCNLSQINIEATAIVDILMSQSADGNDLLVSSTSANRPDVVRVHSSAAFMPTDTRSERADTKRARDTTLHAPDPFLVAWAANGSLGFFGLHTRTLEAFRNHAADALTRAIITA